jgi:hypothetical protein
MSNNTWWRHKFIYIGVRANCTDIRINISSYSCRASYKFRLNNDITLDSPMNCPEIIRPILNPVLAPSIVSLTAPPAKPRAATTFVT